MNVEFYNPERSSGAGRIPPVRICENLSAVMIDQRQALVEYKERVPPDGATPEDPS